MLITCVPVDRTGLPQLPELDAVVVTDLYTLKVCEESECNREVWIGPRQLAHYRADPNHCHIICYFCMFEQLRAEPEMPPVIDLGGGSTVEGRPRTL